MKIGASDFEKTQETALDKVKVNTLKNRIRKVRHSHSDRFSQAIWKLIRRFHNGTNN